MTDYRDARLTKKQWREALSALDNLKERESRYREWADVQDLTYEWERIALWRLRAQMLVASDAFELEQSA